MAEQQVTRQDIKSRKNERKAKLAERFRQRHQRSTLNTDDDVKE